MTRQAYCRCTRPVWIGILILAPLIGTRMLLEAQPAAGIQLLDWIEVREPGGFARQLRDKLNRLSEFFVRATSPDVPRELRRLWRISEDGKNVCLLSKDVGVRYPRWGRGGYILYLVDADTNGDGRIDFNDDFLISIVPEAGGEGKPVAQGRSAVWSPDGQYVGFVRDGRILVTNLKGEVLPLSGATPAGRMIVTNSRSPTVARDFWTIDSQSGAKEPLPNDLQQKYMWLGALSPSGSRVVFPNTMKTGLLIMNTGDSASSHELAHDDFHWMDPAWSPDEKQIAYVSDSPLNEPMCPPR